MRPTAFALLLLAALLAVCACSKAPETAPKETESLASPAPLHTEADYNNSLVMEASLVETQDALYWSLSSGSPYLRYFDKTAWRSGDPDPIGMLCGKPDCTHTDASCGAYLEDVGRSLALMDGRLYWVSRNDEAGSEHPYAVFSANADLTERVRVCELGFGYEIQPQRICFHRGTVYIVSIAPALGENGEPVREHKLIACSLETGEPKVLLEYSTESALSEIAVRFLGSKVYLAEGLFVQGRSFDLYCCDTATGECEKLLDGCHTIETAAYMWVADDGTVYIGDYGIEASVFKVSDGELVPVIGFEKFYRIHPLEKAVVGTTCEDGKMCAWIKSYDGETIFKGEMPTSSIGEDLSRMVYWLCGDGESFIVLYDFSISGKTLSYLIRYDLKDGQLTETLMGAVG